MDVLKKFTIKNLKLNKKRTIVTIIGIMLSTALICAVAGMVTSTQQTLVEFAKSREGNYHTSFKNVPVQKVKYITQNTNVDSYFFTKSLGYARIDESKNDYKPYIYVMEYNKKALENSALKIVKGRMPENSNEVVISEHILTNGRVNFKVGEQLTLDIGTRKLIDKDYELDQNNPYGVSDEELAKRQNSDTINLNLDEEEASREEIVNTTSKTYTIVGIIERPSYLIENFEAPGYTVISYMNNENISEKINVSVLYKNLGEYSESTKQILETIQEDTGTKIKTSTNAELLRYQGVVGEATLNVLYTIAGIVIAIIVLSSIFVIRNSFAISVSEKIRQYGMMASVGATRKQIKKSVLFEGLVIGVIAIPLGILCGIIAIIILLQIVNILLGDSLAGAQFVFAMSWIPIVLSIVVSAITIYLSCIWPAIKASKISPISAIRGNDDIKVKSKKLKTSKLTKKLFGMGGVIASKNLKRSKKKYRTTVISIVVSISIFISLSSFLEYGEKMVGVYYSDLKYNISVSGGTEELYQEIAKFGDINNYEYGYTKSAKIDIEKYGTEFGKEMYKGDYEAAKKQNPEVKYENNIVVVLLNNGYFKSYIKELGIDENDYKNTIILSDDYLQYNEDNSKTVQNFYNIKDGNTVTIKINEEDRNIKITKRTDVRPMGYENVYNTGGWLFVSEDFIENKSTENEVYLGSLKIDSSDATKLENKLIDLKRENEKYTDISITNFQKYVDENQKLILLVSIFLYGFIAVITLIGVTNIFNTITTNMILRSKEFANLKSIGMTSKEFNKMIKLESILYGIKSLIIGIPIGLIGSYLVYLAFANGIDFGYLLPWSSIIISIVFVFIIVGATMKYSLSKINKQNIIETIRKDNI